MKGDFEGRSESVMRDGTEDVQHVLPREST
jgi:hypothetical protein